jgi:hypothetical protein
MSTEHDDNIAKEFNATQPEETSTTEAPVTSLGKVDPLRGRGLTSPDDPEIQRIQGLVGYIDFDTANLPSGGNFYRSDMKIHIRPARVGEIRDFSTMDEQNIKDVDDKLNNMLMMCIKINFGKSPGSYKDLMEEDRIYLLLALRELTFKDGEAQLLLSVKGHDCPAKSSSSTPAKVELRTTNLEFQEIDEQVAGYYDHTNKCYSIQTKSYGEIRMAPPTIGVMRCITDYIREREEAGQNWDKASLQILPYIQREWRGWSKKDIFAVITDFQGWDSGKYSVIFRLAEKMKIGVKPELKHTCLGCGTEVLAPLEFPDGIKSLFVIPDISHELL